MGSQLQLPEPVREYVETRAGRLPRAALAEAAAALSEHYRGGHPTGALRLSAEERVSAYLVTRLPATYAAASAVLAETSRRLAGIRISSLLDLGAGPGAATLAARECFPDLDACTLVEPDAAATAAARQLVPGAHWIETAIREAPPFSAHDLVVAGYLLGELSDGERDEVVARAWRAARIALAIIEPGTPRGFSLVRETRDSLIRQGARVIAPCPGDGPCPIVSPDWCHFGQRVQRSSLHRRAKGGALGYEDEKFSYVVLGKAFAGRAPGRIVRRPLVHTGFVELGVCVNEGLRNERITRRAGPAYRDARKAAWGDAWPPRG